MIDSYRSLYDKPIPDTLFACLRDDISLKIAPDYGLVMYGTPPTPLRVSRCTLDILSRCDGTKRIKDIVAEYVKKENKGYNLDLLKATVDLGNLIKEGVLQLNEIPEKKNEVTILGSDRAFLPSSIQLELTTSCNLACDYCYRNVGSTNPSHFFQTDKLIHILMDLNAKGLRSIELTGGEPLLHPDFLKIMDFCGTHFSLIGLLSNGTMINEEIISALLPYKDKMVVSISLDSHISEVHDIRRGAKGAFEKTTDAVRMLHRSGFLTRVSMSVDEKNWDHIEPTLLLSKSLGAKMFTYSPILPFGRAKKGFSFWMLDAQKALVTEKDLTEKYGTFLHLLPEDKVLGIQKPGGCGAGHRTYAIDPWGKVRPCVTFNENQAVLGSLLDEKPEIVFSHKLSKAFAELEPPHPKVCGNCRFVIFCMNCCLRSLLASEWIGDGKCRYLNQAKVREWFALIKQDKNARVGKKEVKT
ncbi:MAG TPA: radical SAM protein [Geobacteraceae bacterium]